MDDTDGNEQVIPRPHYAYAMKRLLPTICVLLGSICARAEDPAEPPPLPPGRPDVDALIDDTTRQTIAPVKLELPQEALTRPALDPIPDRATVPLAAPPPPFPEVPELPVPPPAPIDAPLPAFVPPIPGCGPLYLDLQTMRPVGRELASFLAVGPELPPFAWPRGEPLHCRIAPSTGFMLDGLVRGYYRNDQRIEWSGVESTFGAEGVVRPTFVTLANGWIVTAHGELFLNKRFGQSILSDPTRDLYRANFDVDTFQIFQLFVETAYENFSIRLGRSRTPFGRYQSPMFTNAMADAQFLRTEVIGFIETGLFLRYRPDQFVIDVACVNGEPDLDTNSSKAILARIGIEEEFWTVGISGKYHDGVSSESQKRYNNHLGLDASIVLGQFLVYGEAVYDQHGLHRDPSWNVENNPMALGLRSLYGRDVLQGEDEPIGGRGAYLGVAYRTDKWIFDVSYGRYRPNRIGNPEHDSPTNRFLFKAAYSLAPNLQLFAAGLTENRRPANWLLDLSHPYAGYFGMQYGF